ncbi:hypothetical protein D3C72_1580190 [compost metagenome]
MQRHIRIGRTLEQLLRLHHIVHRFHLGQHDVTEPVARFACNHGDVIGKRRMIHRMHAYSHTSTRRRAIGQRYDEPRMLLLLPDGSAVFAVQGYIEHATAELGHHLCLQGQAFAHALFHAAVMVAHGQAQGAALGAEQNLCRMDSRNAHVRHQMGRLATKNKRGNASRRLPSLRLL